MLLHIAFIPLLLLFVFAELLSSLASVSPEQAGLLLPGTVATAGFVTAVQSVTMPLVAPVNPNRINVATTVAFAPLLFTGATRYPLTEPGRMRWFQAISAVNPLTYAAEGVRAAMSPDIPHLPPAACIAARDGRRLRPHSARRQGLRPPSPI